jgi:ABC-type transport system substrate-binding protein
MIRPLVVAALFAALFAALGPAQAGDAPKVLRYAFPIAETGFDPAQISDVYSRIVAANIFEAPLTYDYLARPARLRPATAAALPDVSADFRTWVFRLKPGIHFADDPVFKGQPRELVAADYVYSIKRHYDPRWKSPNLFNFENARIVGLSELRHRALKDKTPFDYDSEVTGLKAVDRYTFVVTVAEPLPRLANAFADAGMTGAVAREVIEAAPDKTMEHPVGTGPYRLAEWRRSSRIVLERNPGFRSEMSEHSIARARGLLDLYGYLDRDGDGFREQPDGSPLTIEYSAQPDQASRLTQDLWNKAMRRIGVRMEFKIAKWPEQLKSSRAGKLMMWGLFWSATMPDGSDFLGLMYGPNKGQSNHARFDLPAYNDLYQRQARLPDGPEREALIREAKKLGVAYMPYKVTGHRILTDVLHPWVIGYRRHPFLRDSWRYLDIDNALRPAPGPNPH